METCPETFGSEEIGLRKTPARCKASVIIPAYNEEQGIGAVLKDVKGIIPKDYELIVVDDGSTDKTCVEVLKYDIVRLVRHEKNVGKGGAIRTGVEHASGEYLIFIDADNTYPVEVLSEIVDKLDEGLQFVIGSRKLDTGNNIPVLNRLGNAILSRVIAALYGPYTSDPFSGVYGIRKKDIEKMDLISTGFEIETEIVIKASKMGLKCLNIPVNYRERIGETKLSPIRDGYKISKTILKAMPVYNPILTFSVPGVLLSALGLIAIAASFFSLTVGPLAFDIHTYILSTLFITLGYQLFIFGISSDAFASAHKFGEPSRITKLFTEKRFIKAFLAAGFLLILAGVYLGYSILMEWIETGYAPIMELKNAITMVLLIHLGAQTMFSTIYINIFGKGKI
jgi:glycosyltransferase involved in cell wall biosynthesis